MRYRCWVSGIDCEFHAPEYSRRTRLEGSGMLRSFWEKLRERRACDKRSDHYQLHREGSCESEVALWRREIERLYIHTFFLVMLRFIHTYTNIHSLTHTHRLSSLAPILCIVPSAHLPFEASSLPLSSPHLHSLFLSAFFSFAPPSDPYCLSSLHNTFPYPFHLHGSWTTSLYPLLQIQFSSTCLP